MTAKTVVLVGNTGLTVEYDGRHYEPDDEAYRPQYKYTIKTPEWEYVGNEIRGGCNEVANTGKAMQTLSAFLHACQEGYLDDPEGLRENAKMFPPHVREWAYMNSDELYLACQEQMIANALVLANVSGVSDTVTDDEEQELHHCPDCGEACSINDYSDGRCGDCTIDN